MAFTFLDVLDGLSFPRSGWPRRGIPLAQCETVAQHSVKLTRASMIFAQARGLDVAVAGKTGLVHDFPENLTGDATPFDGLSAAQKYNNELAAFERLSHRMVDGAYLLSLWIDYEDETIPLSKGIKQLDKIDASVQAIIYFNQGYTAVEDFFPWTRKKLSDPGLIRIYDTLMSERLTLEKPYERYYSLLQSV